MIDIKKTLFTVILISIMHMVSAENYIIKDVNIIPMTEEKVIENVSVFVADGRINAIGDYNDLTIHEDIEVINGSGKYLTPGFSDMHTHILYDKVLDLYIANGVTLIRNMHGEQYHLKMRKKIRDKKMIGPELYTSGPMIDGEKPYFPWSISLYELNKVEPTVKKIKNEGYDFIKVYIWLSEPIFKEILRVADEIDIPVVGHVPHVVDVKDAISWGQESIEHFRDYRLDGKKVSRLEEEIQLTIDSGVWNCPTLYMMKQNEYIYELQKSDFDNIKYVPEWQRSEWAVYKHIPVYRYQQSKDFTKILFDRGAGIVSGSDTGMPYNVPGFSLHKEFKELADSGLTPYQVLLTTTLNPAKMLGIEDRAGTIEVGKDADLVLLNRNPLENIENTKTISGVMAKGRWFSKKEIGELLKKAEQ